MLIQSLTSSWTVAVDQRTSGSYRVKEVDAGLGRYYSFEDVAGKDLYKLMTTSVDRDAKKKLTICISCRFCFS